MDRNTSWFERPQRIFGELQSVRKAPEMFESTGRPTEIKLSVDVRGNGTHIDGAKFDRGETLLIWAYITPSKAFGSRTMLAGQSPYLGLRPVLIEVGRHDMHPVLGEDAG